MAGGIKEKLQTFILKKVVLIYYVTNQMIYLLSVQFLSVLTYFSKLLILLSVNVVSLSVIVLTCDIIIYFRKTKQFDKY